MADTDTTTVDHEATTEVRDEPVEVTVEVIRTVELETHAPHVVRLVSRQLEVGHELGSEVIDAATNASVAVARAPGTVIGEIRGGSTLPTALAQSGTALREVMTVTGSSLRAAVGDYVGHQATLPNAVVVGVSDVAESIVRAQGRLAAATVNATFTVATALLHGADVGVQVGHERRAIGETNDVARESVGDAWDRARSEVLGAVGGFDEAEDFIADSAEADQSR